jgi:fatty-acyl-CoA synthase
MRLVDFLDKGASLHPGDAPCLTMAGQVMRYADVQRLSWSVGRALARSGIRAGDKVAVLSGNDPVAFGSVFGISRAGAVWCPVNPRNEAAENRELLGLLDCRCLIFAAAFAPLVARIAPDLPQLATLVCLDDDSGGGVGAAGPLVGGAVGFGEWLAGIDDGPWQADPVDDVVMIAGTGGTTGRPKGVVLTGRNLETVAALALMSYPFEGSPVYLALAPLTHAAGILCFPVMALGGEIVIMPHADLGSSSR